MSGPERAITIMTPGENQRPTVSHKMAESMVIRMYGLLPTKLKELDSYDDRNFYVRVEQSHNQNPHIHNVCNHGYVLKVLNAVESKSNHVEVEFAVERHLAEHGLNCPQVVPASNGQTHQLVNLSHYNTEDQPDNKVVNSGPTVLYQVRLMEFVPGIRYNCVPYSPHLLTDAGHYLGRIHNVLQGFTDQRLAPGHTLWCLNNLGSVRPYLSAITDESQRHLAEDVINTFCNKVLNNSSHLPVGVVHGDYNDTNILVTPNNDGDYDVSGILDFGDVCLSHYVFEVGIAIMYVSIESRQVAPLLAGGHFLSGYLQQRNLVPAEWNVLKECVCARYAQSLVIGAYYAQCDPENNDVTQTSKRGWQQLKELWDSSHTTLYRNWCDVIRDTGSEIELSF